MTAVEPVAPSPCDEVRTRRAMFLDGLRFPSRETIFSDWEAAADRVIDRERHEILAELQRRDSGSEDEDDLFLARRLLAAYAAETNSLCALHAAKAALDIVGERNPETIDRVMTGFKKSYDRAAIRTRANSDEVFDELAVSFAADAVDTLGSAARCNLFTVAFRMRYNSICRTFAKFQGPSFERLTSIIQWAGHGGSAPSWLQTGEREIQPDSPS